MDSKYEVATSYINAANCYRKNKPEKTLLMLTEASRIYSHMGKFTQSAKLEKDIGEIYESDVKYEEAISHYKTGAEYYENENQKSTANSLFVKCGDLSANLGQFQTAIDYFEKSATYALEEKLLSYGARDILFKAFLCRLANSKTFDETQVQDLTDTLQDYFNEDAKFESSPEGELAQGLLTSISKEDVKSYEKACKSYNNIKKLDVWKLDILSLIKDKITTVQDDDNLNFK
jgi:alpha-soluble NSF attachment protein